MSEKPESVSLYQFFQRFPDDAAARDYFEHNCWDGSLASFIHDGAVAVYSAPALRLWA